MTTRTTADGSRLRASSFTMRHRSPWSSGRISSSQVTRLEVSLALSSVLGSMTSNCLTHRRAGGPIMSAIGPQNLGPEAQALSGRFENCLEKKIKKINDHQTK